jgi:hypothetical protein
LIDGAFSVDHGFANSSGSLALFAAMRHTSSLLSNFAADLLILFVTKG